ncbi:MAG: hypothetical protein V1899_06690, partial [Planctomycetota bacterium]
TPMFDPIQPILIFLITAGLKEFFEKVLEIPFNSGWSAVIVAIIGALVLSANALAASIPPEWLPAVAAGVTLIVAIASAFGIHATVKSIVTFVED